jgi:hemolysin activation/secretion protein
MRTTSVVRTSGLCGLVFLCAGPVAVLGQVPGQVQPGQIERQFQRPPEPRTQPGELHVPAPSQQPPANAAEIKFTLAGIAIEGATVYPGPVLQAYYQKYLNREVSLADVYAVAAALTARYRNDGYILSQVIVPAQSIEGGRVRLQAVEGYVARIVIEGDVDARRELVAAYADKIKATRPLTAAALERYLLLMNDLPGAFARATVVASKTEQGASDLLVQFSQRRARGGLSVDNRGGEALGPVRWSADLELDSALGLQERTGIRIVSTLNRELDYLSLTHDEQIGSEGGKLGFLVSFVRSIPDESASFIPLNLQTKSDSGALTYSYPLIRSRSQNLYLRGGLSALDGSTQLFGVTDTRDRIRALRLGATYDLADRYRGVNIVDVEIGQGLRGLGASRAGDPDLSRANGKPDFTKLTFYAARLQSVAARWSVLGAVNAQYAASDLLAPELFSFGGEQFGRGYDPSELVGDHGAAMKLELRYTNALDSGFGYTGYGFYDAGFVRQRTPAGLDASASGASAGFGLRFNLGRSLSGFIELAKPLTKPVAAEGDRDPRGYAGLSVYF